jgi:anti-sigma regulatory factor (Ser/Thr protein kinase)
MKRLDSLLVHGLVSDSMSSPCITLSKDAKISDAKMVMRNRRISGIPIVNENLELVGLISIENIILALENNYIDDTIEEHMVKDVVYLMEDWDISVVIEYLSTYDYGRYPVVDRDHKVVGVLTKGDLMEYLYKRLGNIYLHNKRREDVLISHRYRGITKPTDETDTFFYEVDTDDLDMAGVGSMMFKKFLQEKGFPSTYVRRASIAVYEAEVNIVIHAGGKGYIEAYLDKDQLFVLIVDYGPGIDDIELAMEPGYTTAPDSAREKGFGAGMGLDNVKKYTDKLVILSSASGVKIEMVVLGKGEELPEEEI